MPRFKALIDLSRGTGAMRVALKPPLTHDATKATELANVMIHTRLLDIIERTTLIRDPDPSTTTIEADAILVRLHALTNKVPEDTGEWMARMVLHRKRMTQAQLSPPMIFQALTDLHGDKMHFCASETNALEWVLRMRLRGETDSKLALQRAHADLLDTTLGGIRRISRAVCNESEVSIAPGKTEMQYAIETTGMSVYGLVSCPFVDLYALSLNDLHETHGIFGLEACAATLFREIRLTITYDGTYVDDRHIGAIANTMTFRGDLMSFTRHGINRVDQGPLLRSSFEETVDNMTEAAMFNESDVGCGVTQSVIFGQTARIGTGMCSMRISEPSAKPALPAPSLLRKSRVRHVEDPDKPKAKPTFTSTVWQTRGNGEFAESASTYCPPTP